MQCTKRTLDFISFQSGIHAREWIAPMTAFYLIDSLVEANLRQRYTYRVLQTIQMKLTLLCVWAELVVLGSTKTALKFKYEI